MIQEMQSKDLRLKTIQQALKENECTEIDFLDNLELVITKNQIYVKFWEGGNSPIPEWEKWDYQKMRDLYGIYNVIVVEDRDILTQNNIVVDAIKECNYTVRDLF